MKKQIIETLKVPSLKENFFETGWRPFLGWVFAVIILFDFVVAPGITMAMIKAGYVIKAWTPLTLDAAGFFYLGVGSILTMTSYGRSQEKIAKVNAVTDALERKPYDYGKNDNDGEIGPPL